MIEIKKKFVNFKDILFDDNERRKTKVIVEVPYSRFKIILNQYFAKHYAEVAGLDRVDNYNKFTLTNLSNNENKYVIIKSCLKDEENIGTCKTCNKDGKEIDDDNECYYCKTVNGVNYLKSMSFIN